MLQFSWNNRKQTLISDTMLKTWSLFYTSNIAFYKKTLIYNRQKQLNFCSVHWFLCVYGIIQNYFKQKKWFKWGRTKKSKIKEQETRKPNWIWYDEFLNDSINISIYDELFYLLEFLLSSSNKEAYIFEHYYSCINNN